MVNFSSPSPVAVAVATPNESIRTQERYQENGGVTEHGNIPITRVRDTLKDGVVRCTGKISVSSLQVMYGLLCGIHGK
ncbi:Os04g0674025 [Oryza sativa Japonica Group]|uniref:Os04g0674025 protein n=1 Tax=Oryza sativa subsp. japonica TaxID=39947 RepID=A0A0P0WG93_ORYSJ|nr:hypothetical protein EE612_026224 [Oryza sativa]BAS91595.1 Os04g0674025 [Oryza sativa Japonica Group]